MKIINIDSGDKFADILEAVEKAKSNKLVLIVPKSNKVFKNQTRIELLKERFDEMGKEVSILASDKEIINNAKSAGFGIILNKEKKHKKGKLERKDAKVRDILYPESAKNLRIKSESSKKSEVEIQKAPEDSYKILNTIKNRDIESFYHQKPEFSVGGNKSLPSKNFKKFIWIFFSVTLIIFLFLVFTSLSKAKIKIFPKKEDFSVTIPIKISQNISEPDPIYSLLPGKEVEFERTISRMFPSSGTKKAFKKAEGKITIYNNFDTNPQALVAGTRFQTPEGLIFRISERVVVPPGKRTEAGLEPGKIEVKVIADRAGEDYNIEPTKFTIPGFLGSPRYQGFYAESFEKFSGGFIGMSKFVTEEDSNGGKEVLKQEFLTSIKDELAGQGMIVLDDLIDWEIKESEKNNKIGDLTNNFYIALDIKIKTIAFKKEDVVKFLSKYISDSGQGVVLKDKLSINYLNPQKDKENNQVLLNLSASGQTIKDFNKENMVKEILGKNINELKEYFENMEGIESTSINLSPFWIKSVPKDPEKVEIDIVI